MAMKASVMSRWRRRAASPRDGTSRIQLSMMAGSASAQSIHSSIAWRTWTFHGAAGSTAARIRSIISAFAAVSSATKQASLLEKYS